MPSEQQVLSSVPTGLLIGGQWREATGGATFAVDDPSTGSPLARVADATPADAAAALDAAVEAQAAWAATAPRERSDILRRAFDLVHERGDELALLMTLEMGKPLAEATGEVAYGGEFLRWFSEEAPRISGRYSTAPDGKNRLLVTKRPVGPCLFITPWNFPLAMATRKIAPALAAGCTVVLKPAELTPLTALAFGQIMLDAGLPAGVLNVVTTTDAAGTMSPLIADPRLRKLSFTGSTPTGSTLLEQAAANVLRTSMELGGNAPFLVFDDADVEAAVAGAMQAKMRNGGQACVAANRFLVQEGVADEFVRRLTEAMAAVRTGRGTEDGVTLGPLIDDRAVATVDELVQDAVRAGATVTTGGEPLDGDGFFYPPTVLSGVPTDSSIATTEIFGPVAAVSTFATESDGIAMANDTPFGLVAYVYTRDIARALRLTERLEAGMVGINTGLVSNPAAPFGGVKASGLGREGGFEGIEEYLETVYVGIGDPFAG